VLNPTSFQDQNILVSLYRACPHKYALQSVVLIFLISELICGLREVLKVAPINRFLALGG
jgi:hypothetical protein